MQAVPIDRMPYLYGCLGADVRLDALPVAHIPAQHDHALIVSARDAK